MVGNQKIDSIILPSFYDTYSLNSSEKLGLMRNIILIKKWQESLLKYAHHYLTNQQLKKLKNKLIKANKHMKINKDGQKIKLHMLLL